MRIKALVKKFGFRELQGVCDNEGWRVPFFSEIKHLPSHWEHQSFWVADLPEKEEDRESHALLFDANSGGLVLANKNFMEHAVVVVEGKR